MWSQLGVFAGTLGRRAPEVAAERLAPLLSADESESEWRGRALRAHRWAECELTWPPGGSAQGVVVDVSETGARVRFNSRQALPNTKMMMICGKLGIRREVSLVRRDDFDVGLRFE